MSQEYSIASTLTGAQSIFDLEYLPTSKAGEYETVYPCYFTVGEPGDALTDFGSNGSVFWKLLVTAISEDHAEKHSTHNTLSDSVSIFALGAQGIEVSISGYLLVSNADDHSFEFFKNYVESFRYRQLSVNLTLAQITVGDILLA